jgi:membrane protein
MMRLAHGRATLGQCARMSSPARTDDSPPSDEDGPPLGRRRLDIARDRYDRSWLHDLLVQLNALDFFEWTIVFGAELLWSALPFILLLSSLANERIDDDLSRHIGLDIQGAHIVSGLFRSSPSHAVVPVVTGLLFCFAGVIAVVSSLQTVYEKLFGQEHRRWRDFPRYVVWVATLLGLLVLEGSVSASERNAIGAVGQAILTFAAAFVFFAWTMHFLLAGRVPWHLLVRPAIVTGLLWLALAYFSSLYFSSVVIDDTKTYGTIGVVFTFLTWFVMIGAVIVLGAASGAVWQQRATRPVRVDDPQRAPASSNLGVADRE